MSNYFKLTLCLLLLLGACKRESIPTVSDKDIKNLAIKEVDFDYLTTRSKINYDDGDRRIGATATIRIKDDSLIWLSVSPGFGIEAARALVTRDSVFLMNKLEKSYHAYSFNELSRKLNVPVDYDVLQAALLGEMLQPIGRRDKIERKESQVLIKQEAPRIDILNYISKENLKLTRVILQDQGTSNTLTMDYNDFKPLDINVIPYSSTITASYMEGGELKTTTVGFEHNKAEFSANALSFPFDIPERYDRKN
ncbi:DUF4292 domain-containing protein [Nafulsella turpanensis]|uniref:DUF4292 domain-containing protein n=1 Tax=Nafulsella turpanensis TaxID=1265690 RepID=UPI00034DD702|nr:DUF4292 domain-containing protein [Nafulsella turpanensis]